MLPLRPLLPRFQQQLKVEVDVEVASMVTKELSVTATLAAPTTEQSRLRMADKTDLLVLRELTMDVGPAAVAHEVATWIVTAEP